MMSIMNNFANVYADALNQTAAWVTTHPAATTIMFGVSLIAVGALIIVGFKTVLSIK